MHRLRPLTIGSLLAAALVAPASPAAAAATFGEVTACVDADRFALSVVFTEPEDTEVNFNFVGDGEAYVSPVETFTVNFDVTTLEFTRDGTADPRVVTVNSFVTGDPPEFDRFQDGPVSDFTLTDLGGDMILLEASFPNGTDPYSPDDIVQGAAIRSFSPTTITRFSGDITLTECVTEDTTAPTIDVPADLTVEATSPDGATVDYAATATDDVDGELAVTCDEPSGTTFPADRTTTVTCTATDAADNTATDSFTVTVVDTTPPTLVDVPADRTTEATSSAGATVDYVTPTATDVVDPDPTVACTPASGATLPLGTTTVTCTATDAADNAASDTFDVTVVDTTAPPLVLSAALTDLDPVTATGEDGAVVEYATPTSDDPDATVDCAPASGSVFPVGTTSVTCTAVDAAGNSTSDQFDVQVLAAELAAAGVDPVPLGAAALLLLTGGVMLLSRSRERSVR